MSEEKIFLDALEISDPTERIAYLEKVCADDPPLRERVEALLRSHHDPDSFLDHPANERDAAPLLDATAAFGGNEPRATEAQPLTFLKPSTETGSLGRLDHYEILEIVGRGGMGIVFKARDTKLQRIVAIKALAPQLAANGTARQRFVR